MVRADGFLPKRRMLWSLATFALLLGTVTMVMRWPQSSEAMFRQPVERRLVTAPFTGPFVPVSRTVERAMDELSTWARIRLRTQGVEGLRVNTDVAANAPTTLTGLPYMESGNITVALFYRDGGFTGERVVFSPNAEVAAHSHDLSFAGGFVESGELFVRAAVPGSNVPKKWWPYPPFLVGPTGSAHAVRAGPTGGVMWAFSFKLPEPEEQAAPQLASDFHGGLEK